MRLSLGSLQPKPVCGSIIIKEINCVFINSLKDLKKKYQEKEI